MGGLSLPGGKSYGPGRDGAISKKAALPIPKEGTECLLSGQHRRDPLLQVCPERGGGYALKEGKERWCSTLGEKPFDTINFSGHGRKRGGEKKIF